MASARVRYAAVAGIAALCGAGIGVYIARVSMPPPVVITLPPPAPVTPPSAPAPEPKAQFTATTFAELPGWADDDLAAAWPAIARSCAVIDAQPPVAAMSEDAVIGKPFAAWQAACSVLESLPEKTGAALRAAIEQTYTPYAVAMVKGEAAPEPEGIFTGYYEAELNGALQKGGRYQYPIYGVPRDLITARLSDFLPASAKLPGNVPDALVGRVDGARLKPYFTREQIDAQGAIAGDADVLVWADDPVDVHILHIQGSGRVTLPDGSVLRIGFAGHNGLSFRGIGGILLDAGVLKPGQASMIGVRDWLRAHPKEAADYMNRNARYIFFRVLDKNTAPDGPIGSEGVSLTPSRSLAVDTDFIPLGVPLWLDAPDPDGKPLRRLMVAQDTGAAINGVVRGDYFWGHGDDAFRMAGRMRSQGRYFIFVPKL